MTGRRHPLNGGRRRAQWRRVLDLSSPTRKAQDGSKCGHRGPNDDPSLTGDQLIAERAAWFEAYGSQANVLASASGGPHSCPCCGHVTIAERGGYEICRECGWEDVGQINHDAHVVRGGPNRHLSLADARAAYAQGDGAPLPHLPTTEPA